MIVVQEAPGSNAKSLLSNGSDFHRAGRGINLVATASNSQLASLAKGGVQPDKHDQNYETYVIDHPLPIQVFVGPKN
jgi:hypothetical protein